jgi:hypothetical protein
VVIVHSQKDKKATMIETLNKVKVVTLCNQLKQQGTFNKLDSSGSAVVKALNSTLEDQKILNLRFCIIKAFYGRNYFPYDSKLERLTF